MSTVTTQRRPMSSNTASTVFSLIRTLPQKIASRIFRKKPDQEQKYRILLEWHSFIYHLIKTNPEFSTYPMQDAHHLENQMKRRMTDIVPILSGLGITPKWFSIGYFENIWWYECSDKEKNASITVVLKLDRNQQISRMGFHTRYVPVSYNQFYHTCMYNTPQCRIWMSTNRDYISVKFYDVSV